MSAINLRAGAPPWARLLADAVNTYPPKRFTSRARFDMWRDPRIAYCLHQTARPDGARVVVNRAYKPLGTADDGTWKWVNYENATNCHVSREHFTRLVADGVVNNVGGWLNRSGGYLYDDGSSPWRDHAAWVGYEQKVRALLAPWEAP
jgi:hypothetical protein